MDCSDKRLKYILSTFVKHLSMFIAGLFIITNYFQTDLLVKAKAISCFHILQMTIYSGTYGFSENENNAKKVAYMAGSIIFIALSPNQLSMFLLKL